MSIPFVVMNGGDFHHMMYWWWGIPFIGFWGLGIWVVQIVLAIFVYRDAEKTKENSLLWFILVIIPWVGLIFLIAYVILRSEEVEEKEVMKEADKIIDERFAKGEMSKKEYIEAKETIKKMK
jgi:putative membrane protein